MGSELQIQTQGKHKPNPQPPKPYTLINPLNPIYPKPPLYFTTESQADKLDRGRDWKSCFCRVKLQTLARVYSLEYLAQTPRVLNGQAQKPKVTNPGVRFTGTEGVYRATRQSAAALLKLPTLVQVWPRDHALWPWMLCKGCFERAVSKY